MKKKIKKQVENIYRSEEKLLLSDVIVELPDYEIDFCEKCFQMTNHLNGICQKCKGNER